MATHQTEGTRLVGIQAKDGSDFLDARLAALLQRQLAADALDRGQDADLVTRHPDGAGMIRQSTRDSLADPPGGIGAELEAETVLVLVHGTHEAAIAFLNQVGE